MSGGAWSSQGRSRWQQSSWQPAESPGHASQEHQTAWTNPTNLSIPNAQGLGEAQPPLPPEPDEPPPPLPPDDEQPPLPPPQDGPPAHVSRWDGPQLRDASGATRVGSHEAVPWQQAEQRGAWQTYPQDQVLAHPQGLPGQFIDGSLGSSDGGKTAQQMQPGTEEASASHQNLPSTSYGQYDPNWAYQHYQGYPQQPYPPEAYAGYQGYQQQTQSYGGYVAQPGYDYQSGAYGAQVQAVPPWQTQSSIQEAPWNQGGSLGALPPSAGPITKNEVDAEEIFLKPGRDTRPRKLAVILRGLPGSGKSHIAKKLREVEVEHGGEAPRIHSIDDYFVTEVEKEIVEQEPGKKPKKRTETVMEYLYEPELEDSYKQSILKAFTKTVEESRFNFVILDAPNILVEDFRPFLLAAQRGGYEVYVLKPLETDPEVCAARGIHHREPETVSDLAALYEPTPKLFTQLLVESLFDLPKPPKDEDVGIEEVDMDEEEGSEAGDAQPAIKSRWATLEDDDAQGVDDHPRKKRRKKTAEAPDAGAGDVQAPPGKAAPKKPGASILRKPGAAPANKNVRWPDETEPSEGFSVAASSSQQLESVHYVEGLGPGLDDSTLQHGSFQDHAREERKTEGRTFRDILFGGHS